MFKATGLIVFCFAMGPLLIGVSVLAQQGELPRPEAEFEEELEVTEVLLDVLVSDRAGNIILGLGKDDFVVEEEGEPVEITAATFYSNRRFVASAELGERLGVAPSDIPVDRYFVLFFDDPTRLFPQFVGEKLDAIRWSRKWVETELLPNDYVAVVGYKYKLQVYQDFTTDRGALLRALKALAKGKDPGSQWRSRRPASEGPSILQGLPEGKELGRKTARIYGGLSVLAEATSSIIGRKNVLFLSIGFGELDDPAGYPFDRRYYPQTMQALNDNNVAVYTISLIEDRNEQDRVMRILSSSLHIVAADTGGEYYFNFTNLGTPLRKVVEDNSGYYLLSYRSRHEAGEKGYREVEVTTRNPRFLVRAREGYRYGSGADGSY
jgi:VWFA-related protein